MRQTKSSETVAVHKTFSSLGGILRDLEAIKSRTQKKKTKRSLDFMLRGIKFTVQSDMYVQAS